MNTSPLLSISSLSKNFGGVQAIHDLSFDLAEGELLEPPEIPFSYETRREDI